MMTLTTPCRFRGQTNPLKTAVIAEIEPARNGDRRFSVGIVEYASRAHEALGTPHTHTSTYRFDGSVFMSEISDGTVRVKSVTDCEENGLYAIPGYDPKFQQRVYEADTKALLEGYRLRRAQTGYSSEELAEAYNELGPTAMDVITGKSLFPNGVRRTAVPTNTNRRAVRREKASAILGKIEAGAPVTFPYNGQTFTATVDKINQTTATVTIIKVEGRSNNPRSNPILAGAKGVRVPASILARSL